MFTEIARAARSRRRRPRLPNGNDSPLPSMPRACSVARSPLQRRRRQDSAGLDAVPAKHAASYAEASSRSSASSLARPIRVRPGVVCLSTDINTAGRQRLRRCRRATFGVVSCHASRIRPRRSVGHFSRRIAPGLHCVNARPRPSDRDPKAFDQRPRFPRSAASGLVAQTARRWPGHTAEEHRQPFEHALFVVETARSSSSTTPQMSAGSWATQCATRR